MLSSTTRANTDFLKKACLGGGGKAYFIKSLGPIFIFFNQIQISTKLSFDKHILSKVHCYFLPPPNISSSCHWCLCEVPLGSVRSVNGLCVNSKWKMEQKVT